jgi:hypothetical protein
MLKSLTFAAATVTLAFFAAPASAAPLGDIKAGAQTGDTVVEQVARRCYWHRGHRHCRFYSYRPGVSVYIGDRRHGRRHRHHRYD